MLAKTNYHSIPVLGFFLPGRPGTWIAIMLGLIYFRGCVDFIVLGSLFLGIPIPDSVPHPPIIKYLFLPQVLKFC